MKKITLILILAAVLAGTVFAGDWSFEFVNANSLYEEASMDPYAFITSLGVVHFNSEEDARLKIRVAADPQGDGIENNISYFDFDPQLSLSLNSYIRGKISTSVGLGYFTFDCEKLPKIEGQFTLKAYFNAMLNMGGSNQLMGLDGSYLVAEEFRIADVVSVRIGLHHLSGHYGDEVLEDLFEANGFYKTETGEQYIKDENGNVYRYYAPTQFVRDNEWLASISADLDLGFRPYFQIAIPRKTSWIRPFIHTTVDNGYPASRLAYIGECLPETSGVAESEVALKNGVPYRALRLNAGLEWSMNFNKLAVTAGFDVQANQDGLSGHQIGSFSSENSWDMEYTVGGTVELFNTVKDKSLALTASYHMGRVPLLNFYYVNINWLYIGVEIR